MYREIHSVRNCKYMLFVLEVDDTIELNVTFPTEPGWHLSMPLIGAMEMAEAILGAVEARTTRTPVQFAMLPHPSQTQLNCRCELCRQPIAPEAPLQKWQEARKQIIAQQLIGPPLSGGTFTLTHGGRTSPHLPHDATQEWIDATLTDLANAEPDPQPDAVVDSKRLAAHAKPPTPEELGDGTIYCTGSADADPQPDAVVEEQKPIQFREWL